GDDRCCCHPLPAFPGLWAARFLNYRGRGQPWTGLSARPMDFTTECDSMSMFLFFGRLRAANKRQPAKPATAKAKLLVEALEDRSFPSTTSLWSMLFGSTYAASHDSGATPIASARVQSRDGGTNTVVNAAIISHAPDAPSQPATPSINMIGDAEVINPATA